MNIVSISGSVTWQEFQHSQHMKTSIKDKMECVCYSEVFKNSQKWEREAAAPLFWAAGTWDIKKKKILLIKYENDFRQVDFKKCFFLISC